MNIVILDGGTVNPGDLDWAAIETLGTLTVYERTERAEVLERAKDAEIVFTNKTLLKRETLLQLPKLRYIGVLATGYNVVDMAAAAERGVTVTNVPDYSSPSVAQATFALLLELTNHVGKHNTLVHDGEWSRSLDFCFWKAPLVELQGMTMGIVGFGNIGKAVAHIAAALGMNMLIYTRTVSKNSKFTFCSLEKLLQESDVVSLHCPLTDQTRELINAERLSLMKPTSFLLNTSRGALIDEAALADALNHEKIAGAGLDVLAKEPPREDCPLLRAKNCVITPHIAWASRAARARLIQTAAANLKNFLDGTPQNVVS